MEVFFYHFKCLSARKWPVVDQEDTVSSGVTLNFVDCVSVFAFSVKQISGTAIV